MVINNNENGYEEEEITLQQAKNNLLYTTDSELSYESVIDLNQYIPRFEADVVYLHLKIIFGGSNDVDYFLENYANEYGNYTTQMLINYPLVDLDNYCNNSALDCSLIWNTSIEMVRILCKWGANNYTQHVNESILSDINLPKYRNYLRQYILTTNYNNITNDNRRQLKGSRNQNEFMAVLDEIGYINGTKHPPDNWIYPELIV